MEILNKAILKILVSALLQIFTLAGIGFPPASVSASTIGFPGVSNPGTGYGLPDDILLFADIEPPTVYMRANMTILAATGNPGNGFGKPEDVPPINPPFDTRGRANAPVIPDVVPDRTFPGSDFGQAAVPVPAAAWLFGSGLVGLIGVARRKKAI